MKSEIRFCTQQPSDKVLSIISTKTITDLFPHPIVLQLSHAKAIEL